MQPNVTAVEKAGGSSERLKMEFSKL